VTLETATPQPLLEHLERHESLMTKKYPKEELRPAGRVLDECRAAGV